MKPQGFTLVEVLVVLVILGLTVTFTTLGFQRLEDDRLQKQAGHLSSWLQSVSDNAVLDSAVYGAWLNPAGDRLETGYYHNNRWWKVRGDEARSERIEEGFSLWIEDGDGWRALIPSSKKKVLKEPDILFMPTGLSVPETFQLRQDHDRKALIERDENGLYTWGLLQ